MIRLDKLLAQSGYGSRREVKQLIRKKAVTINGQTALKDDVKVDETADEIGVNGVIVRWQKFTYLMLNKPAGVISATEDARQKTVLDLIQAPIRDLYPVGRLDRDTEGLLLLTNDGPLGHALLSPKKHVAKQYAVEISAPLSTEAIERIENGVEIDGGERCRPAKIDVIDERHVLLTIMEGKFHQVKRMIAACGSEVVHLKRLSMGPLALDPTLAPGEYRECTEEEKEALVALRDR